MSAKSLQSCLTPCEPVDCIHEAPLSMGFSRQEHWRGLSCPPPGDLLDPGIEPVSQGSCIAGGFFTAEALGKPQVVNYSGKIIGDRILEHI